MSRELQQLRWLLKEFVEALPALTTAGVRKVTLGGVLTVELDRVDSLAPFDGDGVPGATLAADTLPTQPPPGDSDDLDTMAVDE